MKKKREKFYYYQDKLDKLKNKSKEFNLHLSVIKIFFREDLMWFLDYNTKSPEGYILVNDNTFPRIGHKKKVSYYEMSSQEKKLMAASVIQSSALFS